MNKIKIPKVAMPIVIACLILSQAAVTTTRAALTIDTPSLSDGTVGLYTTTTLQASGGVPPYTWSVIAGSLPPGLTIQDASSVAPFDNFTNGIVSGTVELSALTVTAQPGASATNIFTVQVMDSTSATATNEYTIVIREGWNHPEIIASDFNSTGLGGEFLWSDPAVWVDGNIPSNAPGTVVNLENRLGANSTNIVDGTYTLGVLRARNFNVTTRADGAGKLIFDNGANEAVWNFNSRQTRFTTTFADAYVNMQLNSDLDFRFGTARQEQAHIGRIGREISGPGHLTLTLSQNDASATRFLKLGEGVTNTYSGGTTVRHVSQITYGYRHNTQLAVPLNAVSEGAFGTGDVTLDATGCTQNLTAAAPNRGMWIKFSANNVITPQAMLTIITRTRIIIDLAADTTNTVQAVVDGLALPAGTYTGGAYPWLIGSGTLVVVNTNPAPIVDITTGASLAAGFEDTPYSLNLTAVGGVAPYTWMVVEGSLPPGLSLSTGGNLSGTPTASTSQSFTVRVTDNNGAFYEKQFDLLVNPAVPPKSWNVGMISVADFSVIGSGSFNWSDTSAWAGGSVPINAAGQYVTLEPRLAPGNAVVTVDGNYTVGGIIARSGHGGTDAIRGDGKLILDNGSEPALFLLHRINTRISALRPDAYVDLQLNSDTEVRMGAMRPEEATVGRIGKAISGPGHLTLSLASHDASATRFHKLGEGSVNTYSGGTTLRHVFQLPYAAGDTTIRAVHLNALSTGAFGTGDVTLDGIGCTNNAAYQSALGNFGRGMWVRFSASDVIASNAVLNLIAATNITVELMFDTTNTAHVIIDGEPLCPGTYTAGQLPWLYGGGYLVVKGQCNLASSFDGTALTLNWSGDAVLQAAPTVTGVYTNVPDAFPPYVITDLTAPQMYYRLATPQP